MDKVGLLQLLAKAQADLASYQAHEEQAAKHQAAAMAELDAIATRTSGRNQALQMAGQTVRQLQEDLDQARKLAPARKVRIAISPEVRDRVIADLPAGVHLKRGAAIPEPVRNAAARAGPPRAAA